MREMVGATPLLSSLTARRNNSFVILAWKLFEEMPKWVRYRLTLQCRKKREEVPRERCNRRSESELIILLGAEEHGGNDRRKYLWNTWTRVP